METENNKNEQKEKTGLNLSSSIVVAALLISGSILFANFSKTNNTPKTGPDVSQKDVAVSPVTEKDFINGDINAEVLLVEYSDFSCGFCAKYHPTMKRVVEEYKGKVAWVYRHLPIFNKNAAVSSTCVGNILGDEAFFQYADRLFENQQNLNSEILKKEALTLGINESEYNTCVNDKSIADQINRDFSVARNLAGFNSTPTSVLVTKDGQKYTFSGALPYEEVVAQIDFILNN